MSRRSRLIPMAYRFPILGGQRGSISAGTATEGGPPGTRAHDTLVLGGQWDPLLTSTPRLRPVFPGAVAFIADPGQRIPAASDLEVVDGHVLPRSIADYAGIRGTLRVRVRDEQSLDRIQEDARIAAIGVAPTIAFYGPVTLGQDFLADTLLDHANGLGAGAFYSGPRLVRPGDPDWEAAALSEFLAGRYEPDLRTRAERREDDAEFLPMPEIVRMAGNFSLAVTMGWLPDPAAIPTSAVSPQFETVPARIILRHLARKLAEPVLASAGADAMIQAVFEEEVDAGPWTARLAQSLGDLGFGSLIRTTPLATRLRAFQIAAGETHVAEVSLPEDESGAGRSPRDFRNLRRCPNPDLYAGVASGRANQRTRSLIHEWTQRQLRCPLVIPAFADANIASDIPFGDPIAGYEDLWEKSDLTTADARVFAANFARADLAGARIRYTDLETLGYYEVKAPGGPSTLKPSATLRWDDAEVRPERLTGTPDADLVAVASGATRSEALKALLSTFRVVRAVSEQEAYGYLDGVNGWDIASLSFGPCHWSMSGSYAKPKEAHELGGLAAYMQHLDTSGRLPGADLFRPMGLGPVVDIVKQGGQAARLRTPSEMAANRTGTRTCIWKLGFFDDIGGSIAMDADGPREMSSWRSVYRWVRIGRTSPVFGPAVWNMTLRRIADIRRTPIIMSPMPTDPRHAARAERTIGSVFTSEIVMALLLRWHVKAPDAVVEAGIASSWIQTVYSTAASTRPGSDPARWSDALVDALTTAISDFARAHPEHDDLEGQFGRIIDPPWVGGANPYGYALDPVLRTLSGDFIAVSPVEDPR